MIVHNTATADTPQPEPIANLRSPRHDWRKLTPRMVPASESPTGCDQTERECSVCGLLKITVHPPRELPYRAWRAPGQQQVTMDHTPPCRAVGGEANRG